MFHPRGGLQKTGLSGAAANAAREAAKAAANAARETAKAARDAARPCKEKLKPCTSTAMPSNRDEITVKCTRDFLVDPPAAATGNAAPRPEPVQCTPVPVPPGLDIMQANV